MLPLELQKENIICFIHPFANIFMKACFENKTLFHNEKDKYIHTDYTMGIYEGIESDSNMSDKQKKESYNNDSDMFNRYLDYSILYQNVSEIKQKVSEEYESLINDIEKYDNLFSTLDRINSSNLKYFDFELHNVTLYDMYRAVDFPILFNAKVKITDQMKRDAYTDYVKDFINKDKIYGFDYNTCLDYLKRRTLTPGYLSALVNKLTDENYNVSKILQDYLHLQCVYKFNLKYIETLIKQIYTRIDILSKFEEFDGNNFEYNFTDIVNRDTDIDFKSREFKDLVLKLLKRNNWSLNQSLQYLFTDIEVKKRGEVVDKYKPIHRFHNKNLTIKDLNKL